MLITSARTKGRHNSYADGGPKGFGKYGVLSFNGNKMITTSGGGALITANDQEWNEVMMYATQYRESYPYYQHEKIGYNYRMSNICAGIGRGQMTIVNDHIAHHKHVQELYKELLKDVEGVTLHEAPSEDYDSNYWLCTITLDENVKVQGQENAYKEADQDCRGWCCRCDSCCRECNYGLPAQRERGGYACVHALEDD